MKSFLHHSLHKTRTECAPGRAYSALVPQRTVVQNITVSEQYSSIRGYSEYMTVYGQYGSPYTRKVEAALRYKRIPYIKKDLVPGNITGDWDSLGLSHIRPKVIPVVRYPDGSTRNDSTYILQELDKRYPERNILPENPVLRFYSLLLEDMFDEWGTKIMFGMRWQQEVDQKWSGAWLGLDFMLGKGIPLEQVREFGSGFGSRQIERMGLVGCTNRNTVIRSLDSFANTLDSHLEKGSMFLLGPSPTVADFALYGQFSQLVVDISPDRMMREKFPNVWAWIRKCEDLSGLDEGHYSGDECLKAFLRFAGDTYLPFLRANRQALQQGLKSFTVPILTEEILHTQPTFKYQDKCLQAMQAEFAGLNQADKSVVHQTLVETNCAQFLLD